MDNEETIHAAARERGDSLLAEQRRLAAERDAMAGEIIAGQHVTTLEEGLRFARGWITTAAQYAANADYFQTDRDKIAGDLDIERGRVLTLLATLRDAVRQGGKLRRRMLGWIKNKRIPLHLRRAIMADVLTEYEDPFEPIRKVLDEALSGHYPLTNAEREVATLLHALETANNQLFDSTVDVEHEITGHADTLPESFRRLAAGHAAAFETLQKIVRERVDSEPPTLGLRGAFSEDLYNEDGSEVTVEQARERNRQ